METVWLKYMEIMDENKVMAKTSSTDAPAKIMVGMPFSEPFPLSISVSIEGTITAGETAASINPKIPASAKEMPSRR